MADDNSRKGHRYDHERITNYVNEIHAPHDAGLDEAFAAPEHHDIPPIMIGPSEGKTLEILCRLAGAKKAVEIGTLAGYSAIWIARGLGPGGKLYSLELDEKHAEVARAAIAFLAAPNNQPKSASKLELRGLQKANLIAKKARNITQPPRA